MTLTTSQIINNLIDVDNIKYDREYNKVAKLHKYWSRKPWFVIDKYIQRYSNANDIILDPFCGSGIIGLQAVLSNRKFIGYDLNPFATFLTKNTIDINFDTMSFNKDFDQIKEIVEDDIMSLYKIDDKYILYTIQGKNNKQKHNAIVSDAKFLHRQKVSLSDKYIHPNIEVPTDLKYPDVEFPVKFYKDRFSYKGVKRVSDMFSKRNLLALSLLYKAINETPLKYTKLLLLAFTNSLLHVSKLKSEAVRPLGVNNYWIPDDYIEENVWWRFVDRINNVKNAKQVVAKRVLRDNIKKPCAKVFNKSSLKMEEVKTGSVDYLITDPPYGDTIQYSELSFIWNCWLGKKFEVKEEVIINPAQNKNREDYYKQLVLFIKEARRVLKNDGYFTLAFHNKDIKIWIELAESLRDEGLVLIDIASYDTFGSPYNKNWAKFSPKSDFYVTFSNKHKKPINNHKKIVSSKDIASEINKYLSENQTNLPNPNKAYDLFVGSTINKIFDGFVISDAHTLSIENVIELFSIYYRAPRNNIKQPSLIEEG